MPMAQRTMAVPGKSSGACMKGSHSKKSGRNDDPLTITKSAE